MCEVLFTDILMMMIVTMEAVRSILWKCENFFYDSTHLKCSFVEANMTLTADIANGWLSMEIDLFWDLWIVSARLIRFCVDM